MNKDLEGVWIDDRSSQLNILDSSPTNYKES